MIGRLLAQAVAARHELADRHPLAFGTAYRKLQQGIEIALLFSRQLQRGGGRVPGAVVQAGGGFAGQAGTQRADDGGLRDSEHRAPAAVQQQQGFRCIGDAAVVRIDYAGLRFEVAAQFQALSEPTRLRILHLLRDGERNVGDMALQCGFTAANLSRRLAALTQQGLVVREGRGTRDCYRIADASVYALCDLVCGNIARSLERSAAESAAFAVAPKRRPATRSRRT